MADAVERPEDLYAVDLGDFVAERKALATRLRADGDRDAATAVMAMRKPPRAAWALNVLARAEPTAIEQVLDAARRVAAAIADGGDELRSAQRDYTHAVTTTVDMAADRSALSGDALLEKMRATVLAAGADPDGEVAADLRAGTLANDAAAPGFSFAGMDLSPADAPAAPARAPRSSTDRRSSRRRVAVATTGNEDSTEAAEPASPAEVDADDEATSADAARAAAAAAAEKEAAAEREAAEKEAATAARAERAAAALVQRRRARERTRLTREIDRRAQRVARLIDVADAAEAAAVDARTAATEAASELAAAEERLAQLERSDD